VAVARLCIDALVSDLYKFQFEIDGKEAWKDKITALKQNRIWHTQQIKP
jgi:hypothetical protein